MIISTSCVDLFLAPKIALNIPLFLSENNNNNVNQQLKLSLVSLKPIIYPKKVLLQWKVSIIYEYFTVF